MARQLLVVALARVVYVCNYIHYQYCIYLLSPSHLDHVMELVTLSPWSCHGTCHNLTSIMSWDLSPSHLDHVIELVALRCENYGIDFITLIKEIHGEASALAISERLDRRLHSYPGTDCPTAHSAIHRNAMQSIKMQYNTIQLIIISCSTCLYNFWCQLQKHINLCLFKNHILHILC